MEILQSVLIRFLKLFVTVFHIVDFDLLELDLLDVDCDLFLIVVLDVFGLLLG